MKAMTENVLNAKTKLWSGEIPNVMDFGWGKNIH